jgi:enoyl-CoA hydratase
MPLGTMYIEIAPPIARVVFDLPETHNPMSEAWRLDYEEALTILKNDTTVSAVIVKSNGRGLSAGGDLNFVAANFGGDKHHDRQMCLHIGRFFHRVLWQFPKPLILQVHGFVLGGAISMLASADVVIVEETARIGTPETRALGFEPFLGYWAMTIGPRWTKLLLYTGDVIDGKTAEEIGMATKAVPADQVESYTEWIAHRIASVGWEMLTIQKEAIHSAYEIAGVEAMIKSTMIHNHMSHQTANTQEFKVRIKTKGIGDAVDWRDAPFGGRARRGAYPLLDGPPVTDRADGPNET